MGPRAAAKKRRDFDPHAFLATIGEGRKVVLFPKNCGEAQPRTRRSRSEA